MNSVTNFDGSSVNSVFTGSAQNNQVFFGGDTTGAQVSTGSGNDKIEFSGALRGVFETGEGVDKIRADGEAKDVSMALGQGQDKMRSLDTFKRSSVDAGDGDDTLVFGGRVRGADIFGGAGSDTYLFKDRVRETNIDLGGNDLAIDQLTFSGPQTADQLQAAGIVITGAEDGDLLIIGGDEYGFDSTTGGWVSGTDTLFFN
ncbi:MAG: hypothetical protein ACOVNL_09205 [Prochlorococcaceae cyanobacterium]